jgi:hypothetical protein
MSARAEVGSRSFAMIDREFLVTIAPLLTNRQHRVYERLVLECDGWDRPITATDLADMLGLDAGNVRKDIRFLEAIGLIKRIFVGEQHGHGGWTCQILRDYAVARAALDARAERRAGQVSVDGGTGVTCTDNPFPIAPCYARSLSLRLGRRCSSLLGFEACSASSISKAFLAFASNFGCGLLALAGCILRRF